jgi:hypothetical protein
MHDVIDGLKTGYITSIHENQEKSSPASGPGQSQNDAEGGLTTLGLF